MQNDFTSMPLPTRNMLDATEPYPLAAWQGQCRRSRIDLDDAMAREAEVSPPFRDTGQRRYLSASMAQFWDALDRIFEFAKAGEETEARTQIRLSLQARQAALSSQVARLLVQNTRNNQPVPAQNQAIYARAERNVYLFLAAALSLVLATSLYLLHHNRRMFQQVAALSRQHRDPAQQLISI